MAILWWAIILGLVVMSMTPGFRMRFGTLLLADVMVLIVDSGAMGRVW